MGPEEALVETAVVGERERRAPGDQLLDCSRGLPREQLHRTGVREQVALEVGVGEVLLPGVLRVARAEHRVDATGGQHRVRVARAALADDDDLTASLVGGDGGAQTCGARSDDEHLGTSVVESGHVGWTSCVCRVPPGSPGLRGQGRDR